MLRSPQVASACAARSAAAGSLRSMLARRLPSRAVVDPAEEIRQFTSFDGLTKHSDSYQLDEIIEMRLRHEAQQRRREKLKKLDAKLAARVAKAAVPRSRL